MPSKARRSTPTTSIWPARRTPSFARTPRSRFPTRTPDCSGIKPRARSTATCITRSWNHYQANPAAIENLTIAIPLANGFYRFRWFDALTGAITSTTNIEVTNGVLTIEVPSLQSDIAFLVDAIQ
ncbi:MAG: hypothetical protein MZU97_20025 [Bacillus subtilis]|nr:hypothetical protein [Bacillus subtilis]